MKLPKEIRRVMAAEAEATRESKAKVNIMLYKIFILLLKKVT